MNEGEQFVVEPGINGISRRELLRGASAAVVVGGMGKLSFAQAAAGPAPTAGKKGDAFPRSDINEISRRELLRGAWAAVVVGGMGKLSFAQAAAGPAPTAGKKGDAFPDKFLWGCATAAHQVEGNNTNSDFWTMEHLSRSMFKEPSGDACDHYHLYPQDISMLADLGFNTYRFSIEWARIEPEEGFFSNAELDHYRRMLATCQEHHLTTMLTYYHFSLPRWFAVKGGWHQPKAADSYARYCEKVTTHLGDLVRSE